MRHLTKALVLRALTRMGELAQELGIKLEVCLYGGALMMLAYDVRQMTRDVDAVIRPSQPGWRLALQVAREQGLPENWITDDVKLFAAPVERLRVLPWDAPGITVTAPTASYMLAMKALACRHPLPGFQGDFEDLRFLIRKLGVVSVAEIQRHIDAYYPDDVLPDAHAAILENLIREVAP